MNGGKRSPPSDCMPSSDGYYVRTANGETRGPLTNDELERLRRTPAAKNMERPASTCQRVASPTTEGVAHPFSRRFRPTASQAVTRTPSPSAGESSLIGGACPAPGPIGSRLLAWPLRRGPDAALLLLRHRGYGARAAQRAAAAGAGSCWASRAVGDWLLVRVHDWDWRFGDISAGEDVENCQLRRLHHDGGPSWTVVCDVWCVVSVAPGWGRRRRVFHIARCPVRRPTFRSVKCIVYKALITTHAARWRALLANNTDTTAHATRHASRNRNTHGNTPALVSRRTPRTQELRKA
eukprot:scaffold4127_cov124-Isochrysis_galbana.AAC.1